VTSVVQTLLEKSNDDDHHQTSKSTSNTTTTDNNSIDISLDEIDSVAAKNIRATMATHKPYWKCLQQEDSTTTTKK
jgi:superoxide dismutase